MYGKGSYASAAGKAAVFRIRFHLIWIRIQRLMPNTDVSVPLAIGSESHVAGGDTVALVVSNDFHSSILEHSNATQENANYQQLNPKVEKRTKLETSNF
jgi:hypothetical protein